MKIMNQTNYSRIIIIITTIIFTTKIRLRTETNVDPQITEQTPN